MAVITRPLKHASEPGNLATHLSVSAHHPVLGRDQTRGVVIELLDAWLAPPELIPREKFAAATTSISAPHAQIGLGAGKWRQKALIIMMPARPWRTYPIVGSGTPRPTKAGRTNDSFPPSCADPDDAGQRPEWGMGRPSASTRERPLKGRERPAGCAKILISEAAESDGTMLDPMR